MIFNTWNVHTGIGLEERIRFESHAHGLDWHSVLRGIRRTRLIRAVTVKDEQKLTQANLLDEECE
jgi:hypothetical protein